jgi:drug/metabolite transporter (DMT)-like permease
MFFAIGVIQYGIMQLCFTYSFQYLTAWQVALMTLFTPIYIVAIDGLMKRKLDWVFLSCAFLTVVGAGIAMLRDGVMVPESLMGCLIVQVSDICFALGILLYRKARLRYAELKDRELYALLYAGAIIPALLGTVLSGGFDGIDAISHSQWLALGYLGLVSSGLCLFWWNIGATKVSTGVVAVLSNIKVPMAVAICLFFFDENPGAWERLAAGAALMVIAVALVQHRARHMA